VKEIHSAAREGKPISSFTEFYNEWSKINEKEFVDLFHSKEFVMLQEEILRIQSELVKRFEKNFEFLLQPFPVASKSQMDEVYKTNHDLKTRMNKLEKELAN
jgi:polyhydroxyalkanoate synthase subunit PhaE